MDELTTSIVGIDFPNKDKSKNNGRTECMLCALGDAVELRLEPTNPVDNNAVAIFSERGTKLGYVSAERAPLIGKRVREGEAIAPKALMPMAARSMLRSKSCTRTITTRCD
jgi:hypothetical protein